MDSVRAAAEIGGFPVELALRTQNGTVSGMCQAVRASHWGEWNQSQVMEERQQEQQRQGQKRQTGQIPSDCPVGHLGV